MTLLQVLLIGFAAAVSSLVLRSQDGSLRHEKESRQQCSLKQEVLFELSTSSSDECKASKLSGGEPSLDFVSFIKAPHATAKTSKQRAVWVSGYPRSGSSTVLSMVSATMDDNQDPGGPTFSLFEPCHDGDEYKDWFVENSKDSTYGPCPDVLWGLAHCDFHGIDNLWGWWDPHSTNNHTKFNNASAHELCTQADVVAFKTVDYGHNLQEWQWLMNSLADFRVLDVVRDPRGIYASWMTLEPFKTLVKEGFPSGKPFYSLSEICDHFDMNLNFTDKRVHRVVFEELMENPWTVTKDVYKFLDLPFDEQQWNWIESVFNSTDCPPPPPDMVGFTDCHENSGSTVVERWRSVLTEKELNEWKNTKSCRRVAEAYKFSE